MASPRSLSGSWRRWPRWAASATSGRSWPAVTQPDNDIELIRRWYRLPQTYQESFGAVVDDLSAMSDRGRYEELLKRILDAYKRAGRRHRPAAGRGERLQRGVTCAGVRLQRRHGQPPRLPGAAGGAGQRPVGGAGAGGHAAGPRVDHRARLHHPGHHLQPGQPRAGRRAAPAGPRGGGRASRPTSCPRSRSWPPPPWPRSPTPWPPSSCGRSAGPRSRAPAARSAT